MALTRITKENVEDVFMYQSWTKEQLARGQKVRESLVAAALILLEEVPECPARTRAINSLVDARMLANAAISLEHLT